MQLKSRHAPVPRTLERWNLRFVRKASNSDRLHAPRRSDNASTRHKDTRECVRRFAEGEARRRHRRLVKVRMRQHANPPYASGGCAEDASRRSTRIIIRGKFARTISRAREYSFLPDSDRRPNLGGGWLLSEVEPRRDIALRYLTRLRQHLRNFRSTRGAGRYTRPRTARSSGKVKQSNNHAHRAVDPRHTFGDPLCSSPRPPRTTNNLSW